MTTTMNGHAGLPYDAEVTVVLRFPIAADSHHDAITDAAIIVGNTIMHGEPTVLDVKITEREARSPCRSPEQPAMKRTAGYLACDVCRTSVPFFDGPGIVWPEHRCRSAVGAVIAAFTRFTVDQPFPLPPRTWKAS